MTEDQALTLINNIEYLISMIDYIPMLLGVIAGSSAGLAFWNVAKGMTK